MMCGIRKRISLATISNDFFNQMGRRYASSRFFFCPSSDWLPAQSYTEFSEFTAFKSTSSFSHPGLYAGSSVDDAREVFDRMPERSLISWTKLISWYSQKGLSEDALNCLRSMIMEGFEPNRYSYAGALSSCSSTGNTRIGKEIHGRIYRREQILNGLVMNGLVNFYGKCGMLRSARSVFDMMLEPNSVSWTSLLSCYCQSGDNLEGLNIFLQSQRAGELLNQFSCATLFGACANLGFLQLGMTLHSQAVKCGIKMDKFVSSALINFYGKSGILYLAHKVFSELNYPDLSAWTALIGGYAQHGKGTEAINLFCKLHSYGLKPNERTFASVLGAFSDTMEVEVGRQFHSLIMKCGIFSFTYVSNAVIDFYSKSGLLEESRKAFVEMDAQDIVSWNTIISGYATSGLYRGAIELFKSMLEKGFNPSFYTYSSILDVCGDTPTIEWGRQTHACILKPGFTSNVVVGSALINMYAKCGQLNIARRVFDNLPVKNLVSWNTMLTGYAQHGFGKEALEIFDMMEKGEVKPNGITFIGVLSACSHVGFLDEGLRYFDCMINVYHITPEIDHVACMVSIFARKGQTAKAFEFIKRFPEKIDKVAWRCLLSGCRGSGDLALAKYSADKILSIDPDDASVHIMLYNIFSEAKMWNEAAQMRRAVKEKSIKKDPGYSWSELNNQVYLFGADHSLGYEGSKAHEVLDGLTAQLCDAGYLPGAKLSMVLGGNVQQELQI